MAFVIGLDKHRKPHLQAFRKDAKVGPFTVASRKLKHLAKVWRRMLFTFQIEGKQVMINSRHHKRIFLL